MPKRPIKIRQADVIDHKLICKIAKESKYTNAYSNFIFSGEDCYNSGRIRVAVTGKIILGFSCFRHRKRNPATVLYFLGVTNKHQGGGVGNLLMEDLWDVSIGVIEFKVMKDNEQAISFYRHRGFKKVGEAYNGTAWVMRRQKETPV